MWANSHKTNIYDLFFENKVIRNKKKQNIECRIRSTTKGVAKRFLGNILFKRLIEPVNKSENVFSKIV